VIEPRVFLQLPSGVLLATRYVGEVVGHFPPASKHIQQCISWNWLVESHQSLRVTREDLRDAVRAQFEWSDVIQQAATVLAKIRHGRIGDAHADITKCALSDDWPAAVDQPDNLIQAFQRAERNPVSVSEQGLLALIADALAAPWQAPRTPVPEGKRLNRFFRLAMFASELMDDRANGREMSAVVAFDEETFSAEILLGVGRLREADALTALVRAHDLYVEILPEIFAEAQQTFETRVGVPLADWITDVSLLAQSFFKELRPDTRWSATLNMASVNTNGNVERFRKIVRWLSRDREGFRDRYASIDATKVNRGLAFQPIRETPFLHLPDRGPEFYAILHADFVLAAADDGVYFAIHDALPVTKKASFRSAFGKAFERYVERVLLVSKVRMLSRTGGYVTASGPAARLDRRKGLRPATHR
jgi:hypothetical protein